MFLLSFLLRIPAIGLARAIREPASAPSRVVVHELHEALAHATGDASDRILPAAPAATRRLMRVLLITPPMVQLNTPYPATPMLTACLRKHGMEAGRRISRCAWRFSSSLRADSGEWSRNCDGNSAARAAAPPPVKHFLKHAADYMGTVDTVVRFLQGKDPGLAFRIAGRQWLPEGAGSTNSTRCPRTSGLPGVHDRARHLASLYIDDLADAIDAGIDARFFLARYAEKLAVSAPVFDPMLKALSARPLSLTACSTP